MWQMIHQNCQEWTTNSKNPLWDGNPPCREDLIGEFHGDGERSLNLKKQEDDEGVKIRIFLAHAEYSERISFIVIILNREVQLTCREFYLHYRTILFGEGIYDAEGGLDKSQNIWGKKKFNYVDIAGKDGFLFSSTTSRKNSFRWQDLKKALNLISLKVEAGACCLVSRHSVSVREKFFK